MAAWRASRAPSSGLRPGPALATAGLVALRLLGPALAAAFVVVVTLGVAQTGGLVLAPVRLDPSRLAGGSWRRLFDGRAASAVAQSLLKIALVAVIAWLTLRPFAGAVGGSLMGAPPARALGWLGVLGERLAVRLALAALAFGAIDYVRVALRHRRSLRMTREEVRRERKETEGDPATRGARRRLHRELSEQRMIDDVRTADFVVANRDPLAVALRYDPERGAAPVVVAKGERLVAARVEQIARAARVPIIHVVPLARAVAVVDEDGEIPPELFEADAELLRVVEGAGGRPNGWSAPGA